MSSIALKFAVVVGIAVALLLIVPALLKPMQQNAARYQTARLFNHVSDGNLQSVQSALDVGADVNVTRVFSADIGSVQLSVLDYAARLGEMEIATLLLEKGANPAGIPVRQPLRPRRNPLYWAAVGGYPDMIDLLLEYGADPAAVVDGKTAGEWAIEDGKMEAAALLSRIEETELEQRSSEVEEEPESQGVETGGETP